MLRVAHLYDILLLRRTTDHFLYRPCNTILARIELRADCSLLREWAANLLANLADATIRVELLADSTGGGECRMRRLVVLLCMSFIATMCGRHAINTYCICNVAVRLLCWCISRLVAAGNSATVLRVHDGC